MEFFNTVVTPEARMLVDKTLASGFLSEGKVVREFELQLEQQLGLWNVVACNSGTSALHLALLAAGVKQGDEVITSPQSFIATALAILYVGAKPVFADIDPYTGNLDPKSVAAKINDKTRAVLTVDWAGYPSTTHELDKVLEGCSPFIPIIEDAAHALGATIYGEPVGKNSADFTCFSFQAIKHLTTADGGAVCAWMYDDALRLKRLRWFGISRETDLPDELGERQYNLTEVGYKYHMNDVSAAIGLGNLFNFTERLARRRTIAKRYLDELRGVSGLQLMSYQSDRESSYWLFPILVENRIDFVTAMKARNIPVSVVHQRIDGHEIFNQTAEQMLSLTGMNYFNSHQIHIPIHDSLTDEDVTQVIDAVRGGW